MCNDDNVWEEVGEALLSDLSRSQMLALPLNAAQPRGARPSESAIIRTISDASCSRRPWYMAKARPEYLMSKMLLDSAVRVGEMQKQAFDYACVIDAGTSKEQSIADAFAVANERLNCAGIALHTAAHIKGAQAS